MRKLFPIALVWFALLAAGCQSTAPYQQGGSLPPEYGIQQGPAMTPPSQGGQFGDRALGAIGNFAGGFARSVAGGAGFSAGRDLWNAIAR